MNAFVDYLNATNNVSGNSTGSLAETQVKSSFYDYVKVDRKLGTYIANRVEEDNPGVFILTGHAGDGKTSILVQVLKQMGHLQTGEGLSVEKEYDDFYYVKDLSEIAAGMQDTILYKALTAPLHGKTSLLISNTGPLLTTFETLIRHQREDSQKEFSDENWIEIQSRLLKQLDENDAEDIEIEGFEFTLVNMARIDNVQVSTSILRNILTPQLWEPCNSCSSAERCPIRNNYKLVSEQFVRVSAFIENYYRYLYENDKRMTVRQMVGQIGYALTGNLNCRYISTHSLKVPHFNYNFANLFFGYGGLKPRKDALQIRGIALIRNLALDHIALNEDYKLFVRHDYSCFDQRIQDELNGLEKRYHRYYQITNEEQLFDETRQEKEVDFRCAVRRFYLMFSLTEDSAAIENLMNQIFGNLYSRYCHLISSKRSSTEQKEMRNKIFDALYLKNTGALPDKSQELPLTLRREDDVFQNVMLVLGRVERKDLKLVQQKVSNKFEDAETRYDLFLNFGNKSFRLSLPMITYFSNLIEGSVDSNDNPALTHGIAQLDALLLDQFGKTDNDDGEDYCSMTVIINTTRGQKRRDFTFDGEYLDIG